MEQVENHQRIYGVSSRDEGKPHLQGQTSARVMIILCPELARAWARSGKVEPITSPINSKIPG